MGAIPDAARSRGGNCILSGQLSLFSFPYCAIEHMFHSRPLAYVGIRSGEVRFHFQRTDPNLHMNWQAAAVHRLYDARYGVNVNAAWRRYGNVRKRTTLARPPYEAACASSWPSDRTVANQELRPGSPDARGARWALPTGSPSPRRPAAAQRPAFDVSSPVSSGLHVPLGCPPQSLSPRNATP